MPIKQIFTRYKSHDIRVDNTWFSGARLYVDNECRDETSQSFALDSKKPILSTSIKTEQGYDIIEVFMLALLTVKMQIHVNGKLISGERF